MINLLLVATIYVMLSIGFMTLKCLTTVFSVLKAGELDWLYKKDFEPKISIIIPAYNEKEKDLLECIKSALANDYPNKEVIVVNDGSTNNTQKIVSELKKNCKELVFINLKVNVGKREAMYAAIKKSRGEFLVVLDSDSIIENGDSLRALIKPLYDIRIDAVAGKTYAANEKENTLTRMQGGRYALAFEMEKAGQSSYSSVTCCPGCYSAYRKSAVLLVVDSWLNNTVFGVKTPYGDDRSLTRFILLNGGGVTYSTDAIAYTNVPNTITGFVRQQIRWKRSFFTEHYKLLKGINGLRTMACIELLWFLTVWVGGFVARAITIYSIVTGAITPLNGVLLYVAFSLMHYTYVFLRYPFTTRGVYGTLYGLMNDLTTEWLAIYALCTLKEVSWGTR